MVGITTLLVKNSGKPGQRSIVRRSKTAGARARSARMNPRKAKRNPDDGGISDAELAAAGEAMRQYALKVHQAKAKKSKPVRRKPAKKNPWRAYRVAKKNPQQNLNELVARIERAVGGKSMSKHRLPKRDAKGHFVKRSASATKNPRSKRARRASSNPSRKRRAKSNPRRSRAHRNDEFAGAPEFMGPLKKKSKPKRKAAKKRSPAYMSLTKKIHMLERGIKSGAARRAKSGKPAKRRGLSPARVRLGALKLQRRAVAPGVSGQARKYLKDHGLTRVNPEGGIGAAFKALGNLLPEVLVGVGVFGAIAWAGSKAGEWIVSKYPTSPMVQYAVPAAAGALTVGAFLAARMYPQTAKWSGPLAVAGGIGTAVLALATIKTKDAAGAPVSLGKSLGLPIGDALLPGLNLGLDLGTYGPRAELTALGLYAPRADVTQMSSGMGAYLPRAEVNIAGTVQSADMRQPVPTAEKMKAARALAAFERASAWDRV